MLKLIYGNLFEIASIYCVGNECLNISLGRYVMGNFDVQWLVRGVPRGRCVASTWKWATTSNNVELAKL